MWNRVNGSMLAFAGSTDNGMAVRFVEEFPK